MKNLLAFLLFLFAGAAQGAISISCSYTRSDDGDSKIKRAAPLPFHIDCSATTGGTKSFHDLLYTHTVNDANATTWSYGTRVGQKKNYMVGPIAAYLFETPGIFDIKSCATDGTETNCTTASITVTDPTNTSAYSGANTICVFNGTIGAGCPSGAEEKPPTSSWDTVKGYIARNKRVLLRCGDTFTTNTTTAIRASGPWVVGAYGENASYSTGPINGLGPCGVAAKPKIIATAAVHLFNLQITTGDIRILDLEFDANSNPSHAIYPMLNYSFNQLLALRITHGNGRSFINLSNNTREARIIEQVFVTGSVVNNIGGNENTFMGGNQKSAFLDNYANAGQSSGHTYRCGTCSRSVWNSNTVINAGLNTFRIHGPNNRVAGNPISQYMVVADNIFSGGGSTNSVWLKPQNTSSDERIYDLIFERNWLKVDNADTNNPIHLNILGTEFSIRNNIFDMTGMRGTHIGIVIDPAASAPASNYVRIDNNTFFNNDTGTILGIRAWAGTNIMLRNNLMYSPNTTANTLYDDRTGAWTRMTSTGQTILDVITDQNTSPTFSTIPPTTLMHYAPTATAAYPGSGGVHVDAPTTNHDLFGCYDKTGALRLGAIVPKASAKCVR